MIPSADGLPPSRGAGYVSGVDQYKRALGKFPTGVAVVTAIGGDGRPIGLTVNSFVSISLEPAVIAWSLRLQSSLYGRFAAADGFAVNVLASHQNSLAQQFAARSDDRFAGIDWAAGEGGCPVLAGAAAVFECELVSSQVIGDHKVFFGGIVAFSGSDREPLIMHSGKVIEGSSVQRPAQETTYEPAYHLDILPVRLAGSSIKQHGLQFHFLKEEG